MRLLILMILAVLPSASLAQDGIRGRLRDSLAGLEMPKFSDLASESAEKAVRFASESMVTASTEFSYMKPILASHGFHIANVRFELLPPKGQWCIVSTAAGEVPDVVTLKQESTFINTILHAAVSAKKVQSIINLPVVVMNIEISGAPNIGISYYSQEEVDLIARGNAEIHESLCRYALMADRSR